MGMMLVRRRKQIAKNAADKRSARAEAGEAAVKPKKKNK